MERKILIVDDEEDVLNLLEKRLTVVGYIVIKANNGKDAIRLARKEQPNLIMLDIVMPGMSGGEVANNLKDYPETKNIPIIFLTCLLTKEEERASNREIKGNIFIAKPYEPKELLLEIAKHIIE